MGVWHNTRGMCVLNNYIGATLTWKGSDDITCEGAELHKALGHPVRCQIYQLLLEKPRTTSELSRLLDMRAGTVHKHLQKLKIMTATKQVGNVKIFFLTKKVDVTVSPTNYQEQIKYLDHLV